jgi:hypothetical protein
LRGINQSEKLSILTMPRAAAMARHCYFSFNRLAAIGLLAMMIGVASALAGPRTGAQICDCDIRHEINMTAFETSQGILAPDVLVRQSAADLDDYELFQEVVDFVNWLQREARLTFSEIGPLAQSTYFTDQYIAQVNNGGHTQYVHNVLHFNRTRGTMDPTLDTVEATLARIAPSGYLSILHEFRALLRAHDEITARRYHPPPDTPYYKELNALDDRFFALDDKARELALGQLLRTSPAFRILSDDDFEAEKANIIARNKLFEERGKEVQAALDKDPMYFAPRKLCEMVGLQFQFITVGDYTDKPEEMYWGVMTSDGPRQMLLGPNFAELYEDFKRTKRLARIDF